MPRTTTSRSGTGRGRRCCAPRPLSAQHGYELTVAGLERVAVLVTDLLQLRVSPGSKLHGVYVSELRLLTGSTLGLVVRDGVTSAPQPTNRLQEGDVLLVFTTPQQRIAAEQQIRAVSRSGRMATWRGDTGG
ncbi:MAG: TrkA C-terminal domain-containing protein [Pseudonocardiaceae bacterium]